MKKGLIGLVVVVLIVVAFIVIDGDDSNNLTAPLLVEDNAVFVSDQAPGGSVNIDAVVMEENGYVVIHEDLAGATGDIVGVSTLLEAGEHNNVSISLDEGVVEGSVLQDMLHVDDGDGAFDSATDMPVESEEGGPIMMQFNISAEDGSSAEEVSL